MSCGNCWWGWHLGLGWGVGWCGVGGSCVSDSFSHVFLALFTEIRNKLRPVFQLSERERLCVYIGNLRKYGTNGVPYWFNMGRNISLPNKGRLCILRDGGQH